MSVLARNPWLKRLAVVLVTVASLGTVTLASTPATARVFVGVGIPLPGWGYYPSAPYYGYGYYGYPAYGYPAYGYPGGFFIGGTFGPHYHHYHHWR
jgi:hypothetical protein